MKTTSCGSCTSRLALASGRYGRGCHHTLRATARLVPDMLLLRFGRFGTILVVVERVGRLVCRQAWLIR